MRSKEISIIVISSLILLPFFVNEGFAQNEQLVTISTDKESYGQGEQIIIEGIVESKLSDFNVTVRIFNPVNNLITIDELEVNNDGTFSGTIATDPRGGLWQKSGTYTIIADYYSSERATIQFEYGVMTKGAATEIKNEDSIIVAKSDESSESILLEEYQVDYSLTGAEIIRITPDVEMKSLIIEIVTYSDGELRITFPDDVIDTDEEGFFVLVDGIETNHDVAYAKNNWSFVIPFTHQTQEIEIVGTFVIPEFGSLVMIVLVAAIGTIIVISARNKQIFSAKL